MKINTFDGGLATRIDPSLIKLNEGVVFNNIDNAALTLKSSTGLTITVTDISKYFYLFNGTWISSTVDRDYLEYKEKLYFTEVGSTAKKYNGTFKDIGLEAPTNTILFSTRAYIYSDVVLASSTEVGDIPAATKQYKIVALKDGKQIIVFDTSIDLTVNSKVILSLNTDLTIEVYRDVSGTYRKLYYANGGTLIDNFLDATLALNDAFTLNIETESNIFQYCVTYYDNSDGTESPPSPYTAEISLLNTNALILSNIPVSSDAAVTHKRIYRIGNNRTSMSLVAQIENAVTTYTDIRNDTALTDILDSFTNFKPPVGLKYLTEAYGMLFGAVGDKLYYTKTGFPDAWPISSYLDFNADITGILPIQNGILVFTLYQTFFVAGTDATEFAQARISKEQGCINHKSANFVDNVPVWVSNDGICSFMNGYVKVISKKKLGKLNLDVVNAIVYNEIYYILLSNGTLLTLDNRFDSNFATYSFDTTLTNIGVFNNTLYGVTNGKICTLFTGSAISFTYLSPVLTEANLSEHKMYNNIYIAADGNFIVKIYIDGVIVEQYILEGNTTHDIKPPATLQRGYTIQYEITGIGTVYEIEYKAAGRQNGR
jgi:hypothetical protein